MLDVVRTPPITIDDKDFDVSGGSSLAGHPYQLFSLDSPELTQAQVC